MMLLGSAMGTLRAMGHGLGPGKKMQHAVCVAVKEVVFWFSDQCLCWLCLAMWLFVADIETSRFWSNRQARQSANRKGSCLFGDFGGIDAV